MPESFNWIVEGKLAGAEKPNKQQLHMYKQMGFTSIVCLQECKLKKSKWETLTDYDLPDYTVKDVYDAGLEFYHMPVEDMKPPSKEQMDEFIKYVDDPKRVVLVHCYGGIGRTGCMVTAYLGVKDNICGLEAVERIHNIWRIYIQTYEQLDAVLDYIDSKHEITNPS